MELGWAFKSLRYKLHPDLLESVDRLGVKNMTAVQQKMLTMPTYTEDCLVNTATTRGRAAAYLLPALHTLLERRSGSVPQIEIVVLASSDLRAMHIEDICNYLTSACRQKVTCYRVDNHDKSGIQAKFEQAGEAADVVVATPAGLHALFSGRTTARVHFTGLRTLILEDIDEMVIAGMTATVADILHALPPKFLAGWQTICLSKRIEPSLEAFLDLVLARECLCLSLRPEDEPYIKQQSVLLRLPVQTRPVIPCSQPQPMALATLDQPQPMAPGTHNNQQLVRSQMFSLTENLSAQQEPANPGLDTATTSVWRPLVQTFSVLEDVELDEPKVKAIEEVLETVPAAREDWDLLRRLVKIASLTEIPHFNITVPYVGDMFAALRSLITVESERVGRTTFKALVISSITPLLWHLFSGPENGMGTRLVQDLPIYRIHPEMTKAARDAMRRGFSACKKGLLFATDVPEVRYVALGVRIILPSSRQPYAHMESIAGPNVKAGKVVLLTARTSREPSGRAQLEPSYKEYP
ncbi:uncharacterized protein K452DRAFT_333583 [Aplosporella prunicola CBS 121167]|uniref:ATP-dependent RNA helicase n=1 Tax=Aplosporella prunicola CBS 121167 TaxID=1176127 RepID=A0A6A6BC62_9PEZI|nr:uncharacterized protein K452DRAFT_333583 [Aplosporella prunicola CBS 121167]KAF2141812.1 hypothetical protein K452DRAFT_333583 [Aplosporella prunicola CBS 121167]